jgi:hypothetical protein
MAGKILEVKSEKREERPEGGKVMGNIIEICAEIRLMLTGVVIILLLGAAVQVADAPSLEAFNPDTVQRYHIDDSGRIFDSDGRLRGWIKDDEVYNPALQLKYRLSGKHLEDIP